AASQNVTWTEISAGSGRYKATYVAAAAGTTYKAVLTLGSEHKDSATYTIAASDAVAATSTLSMDWAIYVVGEKMKVTLVLKDHFGNLVSGVTDHLLTGDVEIPNATKETEWMETSHGTYKATYVAATLGAGIKGIIKLSDGDKPVGSTYDIKRVPAVKDIVIDGYTFAKDAGFPTTGFKGGTFKLEPNDGNASDYTWSSDAPSWVSVTDGVVKFTGNSTGGKVTITGALKSSQNIMLTYSFTLTSWFIAAGGRLTFSSATAYCSSQAGYSLIAPRHYSLNPSEPRVRGLGTLYSEWGETVTLLPETSNLWTTEPAGIGYHKSIYSGGGYFNGDGSGVVDASKDSNLLSTMCRHAL
ncbi:hypothetical protein ACJ0RR_004786, partial [Serratia liquefaciens]